MWKQSAGCLLAAFETSRLHIVIVWYCLTCNRCSYSRFFLFFCLILLLWSLICYHFRLKLCSKILFMFHIFMVWIEMSFQDTNIDSVGNHSGRRINAWVDELHHFGNEKIRVIFYLFRFMSILLTSSIVNRIFNGHLSVNRRIHWINVFDALKKLFASTLRLVLPIIPC